MRGGAARVIDAEPHSPGRPLEKHIHVFFYLSVFSKLLKEVRPPGFFEKIGNRPGERGSPPTTRATPPRIGKREVQAMLVGFN
jgi:hypothetical protein